MTRRHTKKRSKRQRGGYGYALGIDQSRIGGQASVMRYSECPMTDTLSKDYPTALYNSQGGSRRRGTRRTRRSRNNRRKH
jgi:hypothetical protein